MNVIEFKIVDERIAHHRQITALRYAEHRENVDFEVPQACRQSPVWKYCADDSLQTKRKVLGYVSGAVVPPPTLREDIFLDTVETDDCNTKRTMIIRIIDGRFVLTSETRRIESNPSKRRRTGSDE